MRKIWREHFIDIQGIIYVVDGADKNRFEESRRELETILQSEELPKIPIVILGNKIDKKEAVQEEELKQAFGLVTQNQFGSQNVDELYGRPVKMFMCSIVKKTGIKEPFDWLTKKID